MPRGEKDELYQVPGPPFVSLKAWLSKWMSENGFLGKALFHSTGDKSASDVSGGLVPAPLTATCLERL